MKNKIKLLSSHPLPSKISFNRAFSFLFMYCLIPILSPLTENKEGRNILWGIVIVIAMFKSILIPLSNIFGFTIPEIASNFIEINEYLIFVILGYLLSVMDVSRVKRIIIYIIGILSVIIRYGLYLLHVNKCKHVN